MVKFVACLVLVMSLVGVAAAGIVGSSHDLRGETAYGNTQEICKVCHIPHRSPVAAYLGARSYAGPSLTFYSGNLDQPTNSSKVCLSCHDGTLAPSVGTSATDYTHSHPFSAIYPTDSGYRAHVGGQITSTYGTVKLEGNSNNRIECGTCHNPHEQGTSNKFQTIENTNSNLCLTCHLK